MEILNKIQQELNAPKGQRNDYGGFNYRSCEDILEAVKPLLGKATLTLSDEIIMVGTPLIGTITTTAKSGSSTEKQIDVGSRFYVKTTATIKCGDESESVSAFAREPDEKKKMDPQQVTSTTSSYARKLALGGLFAIDDEKDADSTNDSGNEDKKEEVSFFTALTKYCNGVGVKVKEQDARNILAEHGITTDEDLKDFTAPKAMELIKATLNKGE